MRPAPCLLALLAGSVQAATATDTLTVDVQVAYISAPTRQFETRNYIDNSNAVPVLRIGTFPGEGSGTGHGLRIGTAVADRQRLGWYVEAALEFTGDDQGEVDYSRSEILAGGGLRFAMTTDLTLKGGVEFGYTDQGYSSYDWFGLWFQNDGSGHSASAKASLEYALSAWVIGLTVRGTQRSEEIKNPGAYVSYDDEQIEALIGIILRF